MAIVATRKTAAFAGVWTALGMAGVEAWEKTHPLDATSHNILFLAALTVFLFIPAFLFVFGLETLRPFAHAESRVLNKRWRDSLIRALCWFLGGGVTLIVLGLVGQIIAI